MDAYGDAEGSLLFFDFRVIKLVDMVVGLFFISCYLRNYEDGFQWNFLGVYKPILNCNREPFWEELGAVRVYGRVHGV